MIYTATDSIPSSMGAIAVGLANATCAMMPIPVINAAAPPATFLNNPSSAII